MDLTSKDKLTIFDGAIGTEVQKRPPGSGGNITDALNLTQPEVIVAIHKDYLSAGAQVLTTNTFSSNEIRLSRSGYGDKVSEINETGVRLARRAVAEVHGKEGEKLAVAGSIGPTGETLNPIGDWTFDQFYEAFRAQAGALKRGGADFIIVETMESLREATAALIAARDVGLPVISSLSYGDRGRTSYGVVPESGAITLDHLGADVLAINCGTGPQSYPEIIKTYFRASSKPLVAEANAGNPRLEEGKAVYDLSPEDYLDGIRPGLEFLSGVGSCCGSDPRFTELLAEATRELRVNSARERTVDNNFITNNSTVIPISEVTDPLEIEMEAEDLTDLSKKVDANRVNLVRLLDITHPYADLEKILSRQFLRLRSSKPLGVVTDDPNLLEVFLKAYPGIAPVKATGKQDKLKGVADRYGGLLI